MEVDTRAAIENIAVIRSKTEAEVNAVIKANCYGHGIRLAKMIEPYVDSFSVSSVSEAKDALAEDLKKKIYILGVLNPSDFEVLPNVVYTVCSGDDIDFLKKLDYSFDIAIKINTGMNRLGTRIWTFKRLLEKARAAGNLRVDSVYTHFYNTDGGSHTEQFDLFLKATEGCGLRRHCCASNFLKLPKKYHLDMVRCGYSIYGYGNKELKPAMSVFSTIAQINYTKAGEHVGYGDCVLRKDAKIAVLRCGYADGYRRVRRQQYVNAGGIICPVVGQVSMDLMTVDITKTELTKNDRIYLIDSEASADALAKANDTIIYEVLTSFNGCRVRRRYIDEKRD